MGNQPSIATNQASKEATNGVSIGTEPKEQLVNPIVFAEPVQKLVIESNSQQVRVGDIEWLVVPTKKGKDQQVVISGPGTVVQKVDEGRSSSFHISPT